MYWQVIMVSSQTSRTAINLPIATAVSWASPVTNFTLTPQINSCSIDSRTNGFGGSQIPTIPKYTKSCREFPLANAITKKMYQSYIRVTKNW